MIRHPLRGGGQGALTAVAPDVGVQAVRGHPRTSVGVLLGPRGVDEPQTGVRRAGGVEQVDQAVALSKVVGGPLFATAVVKSLVGANVEALRHRCCPWIVVVRKGVVRPVVPVPRRRVWHRQAARVVVPPLGGTQRDDIACGGLQLDMGHTGTLDGVVESHPQSSQCLGHAMDPVAHTRVANSGTG